MCFTFLAAQGHSTGASLLEVDYVETCRSLLATAEARGKRILVPIDILALSPGGLFGPGEGRSGDISYEGADVPPGWLGLDIGHKTAWLFAAEIATAGSVFWNGPMGVFEDPRFAAGTRALADGRGVYGRLHSGGRRRHWQCPEDVRPGLPGRPPLDGRWGVP